MAAGETLVSQAQKGGSRQVAGGLDVPPQQSCRQDKQEASWGERERLPQEGQEALSCLDPSPRPEPPCAGSSFLQPLQSELPLVLMWSRPGTRSHSKHLTQMNSS